MKEIKIFKNITDEELFSFSCENNTVAITLKEANLLGANLRDANLLGANLQGANLLGANLQGANLLGANLQGANLRDANLQGANLLGANLQGANLRDANLLGANLLGANLEGANLLGANLEGANLLGANLEGANLYEDEKLTKPPSQVLGLKWFVLISDTYMKIGCQVHKISDWKEFSAREITKMAIGASKFWDQWKEPLLAMCEAHNRKD